jgi:hypothetical protein
VGSVETKYLLLLFFLFLFLLFWLFFLFMFLFSFLALLWLAVVIVVAAAGVVVDPYVPGCLVAARTLFLESGSTCIPSATGNRW